MTYKMSLKNMWRPALESRRSLDAYRALASLSTLLLFFSLAPAFSSRRAFGGSLDLFRQSLQQSRDTGGGASDEKDVRAIEAGKPIRDELSGGRQHAYRIGLSA